MESNQPPTTYQIAMLPLQHRTASREGGSRTHALVLPRHAGHRCPYIPRLIPHRSSSYGSRTHLSALKGRNPQTDRRTSRKVCPQWVGSAVISYRPALGCRPGSRARLLLLVFSQALYRLSYQPQLLNPQANEKSPASRRHRAFKFVGRLGFGRASQAQFERRITRGGRGISRHYAFLSRTQP